VPSCSIGDVAICFEHGPAVGVCSTITAGAMDGGSDAAASDGAAADSSLP
jgi:hypothetical protein